MTICYTKVMARRKVTTWLQRVRAPLVGTFLTLAVPFSSAEAEVHSVGAESIDLRISPLRSSRGNVFVAVYERRGWLVPGRFRTYRTVPANTGGVSVRVNGLPKGRYAVAVFHDENKNGRVDKNWLGLPAEGFGFTRLTPLRVPSFDEVSVPTGGPGAAEVRMRY
jgi:uncharacterized protein (DUF2141 family)